MRTSILIIGFLLFASINAHAGNIKGAGATACGAWLSDRKAGQGQHYAQLNWVLGYISSYNMFIYHGTNQNGVFGTADPEAISAWLDNFCQQHPLEVVATAATALIAELKVRESNR